MIRKKWLEKGRRNRPKWRFRTSNLHPTSPSQTESEKRLALHKMGGYSQTILYGPVPLTMFQLHPQLKQDTLQLGSLPLCEVLLMNESQFTWLILVPSRNDVTETHQLNEQDQLQLHKESIAISKLLMNHFQGDKLNTAAIGNIVPQLHLHHIVRFKNDSAWPKPVWGNIHATPYSNAEVRDVILTMQALIAKNITEFTAC